MDLSWPRDGTAVNDGIPTDTYLNVPIKIVYPTVDMLCQRAVKLGKTLPRLQTVTWARHLNRCWVAHCPGH